MINLEAFEADFANPVLEEEQAFTLITDAIRETEWWAAWTRDEADPDELALDGFPAPSTLTWTEAPLPPSPAPPAAPAEPYVPPPPPEPVRRGPKIGRNDPCPCGSGKKYKKCCGQG